MLFPDAMMERRADALACRELLRGGSRSFFAASHLLPARVREPATALYAFCRLADDAIDLPCDLERAPAADRLDRLRRRLDRVYAGAPLAMPADRAFAAAVRAHAVPRELPEALLDGLAWDAAGRRYETLADLHGYAARVAGSVGVMMALVMGVRDRPALVAASALGAAMQLTNIARDVGEDATAGRLYLPLVQLRGAGIDPGAFLAAPRFTPALGGIVAGLLGEAERLYAIGLAGVAALPPSCRPGIRAAGLLYRAIGREVARRGHDSVSGRARVAAPAKAALLAAAATPRVPGMPVLAGRAALPRGGAELPAAAFLFAGVAPIAPARRGVGETAGWVLDLFARVEQRRRILDGWEGTA